MTTKIKDKKAIVKRLDSNLPDDVQSGSGVNRYWMDERFRELWKAFRPGFSKVVPKTHNPFSQKEVTKHFQIKGFEYGNWLSQEDRFNYFSACQIALYDLQTLLKFNYNIGLSGHVGIAFGARGRSGGLAHYEPQTGMINLTRFKEAHKLVNPFSGMPVFGNKTTYQVKEQLFQKTGGVGSFGHEYGHALDYFFGGYIEQDSRYKKYRGLTKGHSTSTTVDTNYPVNSMRFDVSRIIHKLIWTDGKKTTAHYQLLAQAKGDYWIRHNEMFARAFEVYLSDKLKANGIRNDFLVKNKYEGRWPYPQGKLAKSLIPHFDSLIRKMRAKL